MGSSLHTEILGTQVTGSTVQSEHGISKTSTGEALGKTFSFREWGLELSVP